MSEQPPEQAASATAARTSFLRAAGRPRYRRFIFITLSLITLFALLTIRLLWLGTQITLGEWRAAGLQKPRPTTLHTSTPPLTKPFALKDRPAIYDRNGIVLASNISTPGVWANPSEILFPTDTADQIAAILPAIKPRQLATRLARKDRKFIWISRKISPADQNRLYRLGLAGIYFNRAEQRSYPYGRLTSHLLGFVNSAGQGQAGIEAWLDKTRPPLVLADLARQQRKPVYLSPVHLTIDSRIQFAMRQNLLAAMRKFNAKGAGGVMIDIYTGEVYALVSLPDFDPARPAEALRRPAINRISRSLYELGSIHKIFTAALALELGLITGSETVDVATPLRFGRYVIKDHHAPDTPTARMSLDDIFVHSSNLGSARLALRAGVGLHKAFLTRLGLLNHMHTGLGPLPRPLVPQRWKSLTSATIAFGHGLSITPLQFTASAASLFNDGRRIRPIFVKTGHPTPITADNGANQPFASLVVSARTRERLRQLMWENVKRGTGRKAAVADLLVGGKTGTAEKPVRGGYDSNRQLSSFVSIFPGRKPRFLMLLLIDEPQRAKPGKPGYHGSLTAAYTAAPVSAAIIRQIVPFIMPVIAKSQSE